VGTALSTASNAARTSHVPGEVGVWVFIFGDMTAFAVMFGSYLHEQRRQSEYFVADQHLLDTALGMINTVLLLTGSLFVVLGVRAARAGTIRAASLFGLGFACGAGFVVNKVIEFVALLGHGTNPTTAAFFAYFFFMAGVHLLHVLAGLVVLMYLVTVARKPVVGANEIRRLENGASYWHLVDLLWIVLFPLLYLMH
jgi:nitric oxide reductase NorE protein